MTGTGDTSVTRNDLLEWQKHTQGEFNIRKFKGGHFYINESMEAVVKHIGNVLVNSNYLL
jgi:surfactin synthase thioesterase subunit